MEILFNLAFTSPVVAIVNLVILFVLVIGIIAGYKKGFLESSVRFLGLIAAIIGAYILKNPVSVFLYTYCPFFKLGGVFKGVTVINILIYELIAFLVVLTILLVVIKIVCKITGLVDRLLSFILLFGLPNKILGAIVGFIETIVILYFLIFVVKFGTNLAGYEMEKSLADDILDVPVLKNTFGPTVNALNDISSIAKKYDSINSKDVYNYEALDILLKYDIIVKENVETLVEKEKIDIPNIDVLLEKYGD